eukprot:scaffold14018_cov200-Alexandrium_tamarense.AAC.1
MFSPPQSVNGIAAADAGASVTLCQPITSMNGKAVPLSQWNDAEGVLVQKHQNQSVLTTKALLLRKVSVSYGIATLLKRMMVLSPTQDVLEASCSITNFSVRTSREIDTIEPGWEVQGVDMISPPISVQIKSTASASFLWDVDDESFNTIAGRVVEAVIESQTSESNDGNGREKDGSFVCHLFGVLLHKLFAGYSEIALEENVVGGDSGEDRNDFINQPPPNKRKSTIESIGRKGESTFPRATSISELTNGNSDDTGNDGLMESFRSLAMRPLTDFGCPSTVSQLIQDLIDCGWGVFRPDDAYSSLDVVIRDLELLLRYPERFLFEAHKSSTQSGRPIAVLKDKLYGREAEAAHLTEAFCRVRNSGESEAFFVGGFSGSGKTSLVKSVFEGVQIREGFVVTKKFDEIASESPLSAVISVFNELCVVVKQRSSWNELVGINQRLINEFGANFLTLAHILPNVQDLLLPGCILSDIGNQPVKNEVNFSNLCFIIQHFMRVVSSPSRPVVLFLDDLQWSDAMSLGLVHSVLSDLKGSSCMFFVGSYRDNEVRHDHIIFGLLDMLASFNVTSTKVHLDGMNEDDLNLMISDALAIFPRLCKPLSDMVYHKTDGNPFFVLEFLRSLSDRGLIQYSLRDRKWLWDLDAISAEDITDNVIQLLSNKMSSLQANLQSALKVAACFGTKITGTVVKSLTGASQYSTLPSNLDQAVRDGFMDNASDGGYQFVHDKVREAAYGLIQLDERDRYHFDIGMTMHSNAVETGCDDLLIFTIENINRGVPTLIESSSQRAVIAELNFQAGSLAMECSNFVSAHSYLKKAVSLLPSDSWCSQYASTLKFYSSLAKSAHHCGFVDETRLASNAVLENGSCLKDKLDSYFLLTSILQTPEDRTIAFITCHKVLHLLGELLQTNELDNDNLIRLLKITRAMFEDLTDEVLLTMHTNEDWKQVAVMRFYSQLAIVTYVAKPNMLHCYASRWAQYSLRTKVASKFTASAYATFAVSLCNCTLKDINGGYRIGKIALRLLNQTQSTGALRLDKWSDLLASCLDELPRVFMSFYGYVGCLIEPLQASVDMLRHGYETGLQVGELSHATINAVHMVSRAVLSGMNLRMLQEEVAFQLKLAQKHSRPIMGLYFKAIQETITMIIGDESTDSPANHTLSTAGISDYIKTLYLNRLMCSFILGHSERAEFYANKWQASNADEPDNQPIRGMFVWFYFGMASASLYRKKGRTKLMVNMTKALDVLREASAYSQWNFHNKVCLLEAEICSLNNDGQSDVSYDIS